MQTVSNQPQATASVTNPNALRASSGSASVKDSAPCFWCGDSNRTLLATRGDGVEVLECGNCKHRAVSSLVIDLDEVYGGDAYFQKDNNTDSGNFGYANYEQVSFANWNAEFFSALLLLEGISDPSVIDIGCATGTFLDLAKSFGIKTYGVEPSPWAQQKCIEKGHKIAAATAEELETKKIDTSLVTAFHVVEHLVSLDQFFKTITNCIGKDNRFLAVFPHVNFKQENWSGRNDSFEHISYFDAEFVKREFAKKLPEPFEVLFGPDLIFCFGGNLTEMQLKTIATVNDILQAYQAPALQAETPDEKEHRHKWLNKKLQPLSLYGLVFVVNFLARNHSATLAKEILQVVSNFKQWQQEPGLLSLSHALIHRQNGNVYGAANYLSQITLKASQESNLQKQGIRHLRSLVEQELPKLIEGASTNEFPKISIWLDSTRGAHPEFFASIAEQTYPNFELVLLDKTGEGFNYLPPAFKSITKHVKTAGKSTLQVWQEAYKTSAAELIFLTSGQYCLSEFCLFALYYPLLQNPISVVKSKVTDKSAEQAKLFPGQRLIEKLLRKPLFTSKDSSQSPPFLLFNKQHVSFADIGIDSIHDPAKLNSFLNKQEITQCQDVLGWLQK